MIGPAHRDRPAKRPARRWAPSGSRRVAARWWLERHRRPLLAGLVGLAVWSGLAAVRAHPAPTTAVLVAVRDLATGTVVAPADVRAVGFPAADIPPTALHPGDEVVGRTLATAVPAGVPVTADSFTLGAALPAGTVAVPVVLADPAERALVTAGDRVDVLAVPGPDAGAGAAVPSTGAVVVAGDVTVLAVPGADAAPSGGTGGLVVIAATPRQAALLASAAAVDRLSLSVRAW